MPTPVQAIYRDVDPDVPATYELPPGSDFEFASSRVRLDGSGASGTFIPVLDVLTQDNRILASARPDQEFAVGDTGAITWAPFLRRAAAPVAATGLPWAYYYEGSDETDGSGGSELALPGPNFSPGAGGAPGTNDDQYATSHPAIFDWLTGSDVWTVYEPGIYACQAAARWSTFFAGNQYLTILNPNGFLPWNGFNYHLDHSLAPNNPQDMYTETTFFMLALNGTFDVLSPVVFQNSGINRVISYNFLSIVQLASFA